MAEQRQALLHQWAEVIDQAAHSGAVTGDANKPIVIKEIAVIVGPRAGALEIGAWIIRA